MSNIKHVSMESYKWGHFGVILFDVVTYGAIAFLAVRVRNSIDTEMYKIEGNTIKRHQSVVNVNIKRYATLILYISIFMIIFTTLGLWPVFKEYDAIDIS